MNLSRKRKKELRQLQQDAGRLWESQQVLVGHAADIAREAGRQLGNFNREQVIPTVQETYERRLAPTVDRGVKFGKHAPNGSSPGSGKMGSCGRAWRFGPQGFRPAGHFQVEWDRHIFPKGA